MKHKVKAIITFEYEVNYSNDLAYTCADDEDKKAKSDPKEWAIDSGFDIEKAEVRVELKDKEYIWPI